MMRFDRRRRPEHRNRFDDIGVKRALREEFYAAELLRFLFENFDELVADALAFDLGIFNAF